MRKTDRDEVELSIKSKKCTVLFNPIGSPKNKVLSKYNAEVLSISNNGVLKLADALIGKTKDYNIKDYKYSNFSY